MGQLGGTYSARVFRPVMKGQFYEISIVYHTFYL